MAGAITDDSFNVFAELGKLTAPKSDSRCIYSPCFYQVQDTDLVLICHVKLMETFAALQKVLGYPPFCDNHGDIGMPGTLPSLC